MPGTLTPAAARAGDVGPRPVRARTVVLGGAGAALVAGAAMAAWLMFCAEVAAEATATAGIRSSTWTPITAITALVFGDGAFSGDFAAWSILGGLMLLLAYAVVAGIPGAALLIYTLGGWPGTGVATVFGLAYGVALEVLVVNLLINGIQEQPQFYEALPSWGWWVGHGTYGLVLALLVSRRLRRGLR